MVSSGLICLVSYTGGTEVFSWGNGANYQLGTGTVGIQKLPCRLDALQGLNVIAIAAAKFHSMAITADGKLYSWGFGRGGRLGHNDFDIHRCNNKHKCGKISCMTHLLIMIGFLHLGNLYQWSGGSHYTPISNIWTRNSKG